MVLNRWGIVVASAVALIAGQGGINVFAAGIFMKPVAAELGFGRGTIATAIGSASLWTALCMPFFGYFLDRFGVRRVLLPSIVLFAAAVAATGLLTASVPVLFLLFALCGIFGVGQNPTAYSKVICEWFDRQRGLALGIALAGVGAGTALLPQVATFLIGHFGWRLAYAGLGATVMIVAFLPVLLFIREPSAAIRSAAIHDAEMVGKSFREACRDWRFWALATAFFLGATTINGTLVHVVPLLTDKGIPIGTAIGALSAAGLALIGGRVAAGFIMDFVFAPFIAIFFMLVPLLGIALLATGTESTQLLLGTVCLGMGIGAEIDVMSFIIARYFGMRAFGAMHGLMFTGALLGNTAGASILGYSFQVLHGYGPGFILFGCFLVVGSILFCLIGPYRYPAETSRAPALSTQRVTP